jgi:diphthamide biosynthesis protein 2
VRVFGIIVATLSAAHFRPLLEGLKAALRAAGRRWYVLLVGKLNPAKLANFPDIGMFVLIGGARASAVESRDYLAPIITPYELLIALTANDGEWTGEYLLDFKKLLPRLSTAAVDAAAAAAGARGESDEENGAAAGAGPRLSLLTGQLERLGMAPRGACTVPSEPPAGSSSSGGGGMVTIGYETTVSHFGPTAGGAAYLQSRIFQGLDPTPGAQPVQTHVPQGRAGVASGYAAEGAAMASGAAELSALLSEANALNDVAGSGEGQ